MILIELELKTYLDSLFSFEKDHLRKEFEVEVESECLFGIHFKNFFTFFEDKKMKML